MAGRDGRPRRCPAQLRTANQMFVGLGAGGFAGRAERELHSTGEQVRNARQTPGQLTARETQIARLAADGQSNPEIAAQLFRGPRPSSTTCNKVPSPSSPSLPATSSTASGRPPDENHGAIPSSTAGSREPYRS